MTKLRAALVHLLPPGGAWRAMVELTSRTTDQVDYELFSLDLGRWDTYGRPADLGLADSVQDVTLEPLRPAGRPPGMSRLGRAADLVLWPMVLGAERRLAGRIDEGGFDVVVAHHNRYFGSPSVLRHLQTQSVYYVQEPRRANHEYRLRPERRFDRGSGLVTTTARAVAQVTNEALRRIDVGSARAATSLLCNSRFSAESIARAYGRDATVSPLGVDLETFNPGPSGDGMEAGGSRSNTVLSIGAVAEVKGHDLVVEALSLMPSDRRPRLVIPSERGESDYRDALVRRARELDVELHLAASITDAELVDLYRSALATVCASHLEPLGLTAYESMACGTPVVAVDEGGFRETVHHGVNGLVVPRCPVRMAEALEAIVTGRARFDPVELRTEAETRFSWDVGAKVYLDSLLATASGGSETASGGSETASGGSETAGAVGDTQLSSSLVSATKNP